MSGKIIKNNCFLLPTQTTYTCTLDWPDDCDAQCGGRPGKWFFEAFPTYPRTYVRGESPDSIPAAEGEAWAKYQLQLNCPHVEFARQSRLSTAGQCPACGLVVEGMYQPLTICETCGQPANSHIGQSGKVYCSEHFRDMPFEDWSELEWMFAVHDYVMDMMESGREDEVNIEDVYEF